MKKVQITILEDGELSIAGTPAAGNIHIEEYEGDEIIGGSYATYDNVADKLREFFSEGEIH